MDLFKIDYSNNDVEINKADIFLISEFADLKDEKYFKKLLVFIYLMIDWRSPYNQYNEYERNEAALVDSKLTQSELSLSKVKKAINKYKTLQESSRIGKLLNSAYGAIDKIQMYFDTLDLSIVDPLSGKPIYSTKNVIAEISSLGKLVDGLNSLEVSYKKEQEIQAGLRGGREQGLFEE